jgi:hypothetical protein
VLSAVGERVAEVFFILPLLSTEAGHKTFLLLAFQLEIGKSLLGFVENVFAALALRRKVLDCFVGTGRV